MSDTIALRGIEVFAHHGVLASEKLSGQVFVLDIDLHLDLTAAGSDDDLGATIDYGELAEAVADRVSGERWDLIESVGRSVLDLIFEYPSVEAAEVTVHKPNAPITVPFEDVSVTMRRSR